MNKKAPPEPKEKPQRERFIEFAKEHGADKDAKALDRAFPKVVRRGKRESSA